MNYINNNKFNWNKKRKALSAISLFLFLGECVGLSCICYLTLKLLDLTTDNPWMRSVLNAYVLIAIAICIILSEMYLIQVGYLKYVYLESIKDLKWSDKLLYFVIGVFLCPAMLSPIFIVTIVVIRATNLA